MGCDVPRNGLEAVATTSKVGSIDDIVQHFWVGIENRVYKTNWALTADGALFVNLQRKLVSRVQPRRLWNYLRESR